MTDWEKFLERRSRNIGFISKLKAFRDPTPDEKAAALASEIKAWQESIGKKTFHLGMEYSISRGYEYDIDPGNVKKEKAIDVYVKTPMEVVGRYEGMDLSFLNWKEVGIIKAFIYWVTGRKVRRKND